MTRLLTLAALSALSLAACGAPRPATAPAPTGDRPVLVGYLAGWGVRSKGTRIDSLPADWLNVMTYDYHAGGRVAHFNAPLHAATDDPTPRSNVDSTVAMYLRGGMPAAKLVIGVPFYARSYGGVPATNDGLFQPSSSAAPREWSGTAVDARHLSREGLAAVGFVLRREPLARALWAYHPGGVWITFDDAESLAEKADFVRERGLGGVMIWELGGDDGRMVGVLAERLRRR